MALGQGEPYGGKDWRGVLRQGARGREGMEGECIPPVGPSAGWLTL